MLINQSDVEHWELLRAFPEDFEWCTRPGRTRAQVVERYAHLLLHLAPSWFTDAEFDQCVELVPWAALQFAWERLSQEQFDRCVERAPGDALVYARARLSTEQLTKAEEALR